MLALQNHYSYIHIGHKKPPTWNSPLPQHKPYEAMFERPAKRKYNETWPKKFAQPMEECQREKIPRITNDEIKPRDSLEQQYYRLCLESPHLIMPSFPNLPLTPRNLAMILREQMAAMQIREQLLHEQLDALEI